MKIKYLSGKKINTIVDLDDVQAKGLIEDGIAEAVADADPLEDALKGLEVKINGAVESAVAKAVKGINKYQPTIVVGPENIESDPAAGFKSMGHFALDVMKQARGEEVSDNMKRYMKSTTGNTSGNAPDAGPAVPVQYATDIFKVTGDIPDFAAMGFQVPMTANTIKIPVLKNYVRSNSTVANGVVAAVISEASAITQSRTNWEQLSLTLAKEAILVPASDELLEDNIVAIESVIAGQAAYQIRKAVNRGILQGSSAFTAIIGHASAVDVAKESAQTAATVNFANISKMYAAFAHDDADYNNAVWYAHPTVLPQLFQLTSGNYNVYTAPGAANDSPTGRLFGRPLIVTGQCNALGTSGDLVLADMKKYVVGSKGGINAASSMHLFFNTQETAFRFTLRTTGKPGLTGPITLEDASTQVSPFVTLATRS